jgi:hypothetical protein
MSSVHCYAECPACAELVRKESYVTHIRKTHQNFFWDEMVSYNADGSMKNKLLIKDFLEAMSGLAKPYWAGQEPGADEPKDLYVDFGNNTLYCKDLTAIKHIQEHPDKHQEKWLECVLEGLDKDRFVKLMEYVIRKPEVKVRDQELINKIQQDANKEVEKAKSEVASAVANRDFYIQQFRQLQEDTEETNLQKMRNRIYELEHSLDKAISDGNKMMNEIKLYRRADAERTDERRVKAEQEYRDFINADKIKEKHEKEMDKLKGAFERKLEKEADKARKEIKKDAEKKTEKLQKKLKAMEYKLYETEQKLKKAKSLLKKNGSSVSSLSDSDSDSDSSDSDTSSDDDLGSSISSKYKKSKARGGCGAGSESD